MSGRFISLEGGEGAGKSTQARRLVAALAERGIAAIATREPGGSDGAEAIRDLLMRGDADRWSARAETLLFAAARADHVEKTIRPALAAGQWVICDRFVDSTRAYQGAGGGIDDGTIMALHAVGSGGLLPDRTFVLTVSPEAGAARATARDGVYADRFAARGTAFHDAVSAGFRHIANAEPARVRITDGDAVQDDVTAAILDGLVDLLP